jgi:ribosomal protein S14
VRERERERRVLEVEEIAEIAQLSVERESGIFGRDNPVAARHKAAVSSNRNLKICRMCVREIDSV